MMRWTLWFENQGRLFDDSRRYYDWTDRILPAAAPLAANGILDSIAHCSGNLALATDIGPRLELIVCTNCCPETKMGIATTGDAPPAQVERVDPESADSLRLADGILPIFEMLESEAIVEAIERQGESGIVDGRLRYYGQPLDAARRRTAPLRVQRIARISQVNNGDAYYLEIIRDYGNTAMPAIPCPGVSFLRTWVLMKDGSDLRILDQDFGLWDCDMKGADFDTPLVFWRAGTGADLLIRRTGWESEDYLIISIDGEAAVIRTDTRYRR